MPHPAPTDVEIVLFMFHFAVTWGDSRERLVADKGKEILRGTLGPVRDKGANCHEIFLRLGASDNADRRQAWRQDRLHRPFTTSF